MVDRVLRIAWVVALVGTASACRKTAIRATCTVRRAGSYCTFQNTGRETARACFLVTVSPPAGLETYASAHVCSGRLARNERSAPAPFAFAEGDPFERCAVGPSGTLRGCVTRVATERLEIAP